MSVSVVIPAYNAGRFIEEAIASALGQEFPPDEIIVVNDGSTDRNYLDLRGLHGTVKVVEQPNGGVSAARNLGCSTATSDYIAILDADDVWLPGKLGAQMRHLGRHPDMDAVFCRGLLWVPASNGSEWVVPPITRGEPESVPGVRHLHYPDFLCSASLAPSTMVVKRSVWKELKGFNECMRFGEDLDFYLRLSHGGKVDLLDMVGMLYRQHPASATAVVQEENHWADVLTGAVKTLGTTDKFGHCLDPAKFAKHLSYVYFLHGYDHFRSDSFRIARREFALALKMDPLRLKVWACLAISSFPGLRTLLQRSRRQSAAARQPSTATHVI